MSGTCNNIVFSAIEQKKPWQENISIIIHRRYKIGSAQRYLFAYLRDIIFGAGNPIHVDQILASSSNWVTTPNDDKQLASNQCDLIEKPGSDMAQAGYRMWQQIDTT